MSRIGLIVGSKKTWAGWLIVLVVTGRVSAEALTRRELATSRALIWANVLSVSLSATQMLLQLALPMQWIPIGTWFGVLSQTSLAVILGVIFKQRPDLASNLDAWGILFGLVYIGLIKAVIDWGFIISTGGAALKIYKFHNAIAADTNVQEWSRTPDGAIVKPREISHDYGFTALIGDRSAIYEKSPRYPSALKRPTLTPISKSQAVAVMRAELITQILNRWTSWNYKQVPIPGPEWRALEQALHQTVIVPLPEVLTLSGVVAERAQQLREVAVEGEWNPEEATAEAEPKSTEEDARRWARQVALLIVALGNDAYPGYVDQSSRDYLKQIFMEKSVADLIGAAHANSDSLRLGEPERVVAARIYVATTQVTLLSLLKCIKATIKRANWKAYGNWSASQDRQGAGAAAAIEQLVTQARNGLFQRASSLPIVRAKGTVRSCFVRPSQVDMINGFAAGARIVMA